MCTYTYVYILTHSNDEPGGLTTRQPFPLHQAIDTGEGSEVIGGDVVEFNPRRDLTYPVQTVLGRAPVGPTAMVAAKVVFFFFKKKLKPKA